jgi:futalosine hydrolase
MKIIIVSATALEVVIAANAVIITNGNISFNTTGIGMLSTAVNLTKIIYEQKPNFVIQAGIAGCFNKSIPLATTMLVESEYVGDLGVIENNQWNDIFDLNLMSPNDKPFIEKKITNPKVHQYNFLNLPIVNAVSVNQISTNASCIQQLESKYNPCLETMEGAALHYVCNSFQIPYLQIRSVSNYIGERDKKKWKMKLAIDNLNKELKKIMRTL